MGILTKLFGIDTAPPPPDSEDDEDAEVVVAKNAEVRSVIDQALDEWQRDLAKIGASTDARVSPAETLRQARRQAFPR